MKCTVRSLAAAVAVGLLSGLNVTTQPPQRNIILFVADGLRHQSVDERETPALSRVGNEGVRFGDSHSLFPTFTTANASAIATGHGLGDTGDFSNTIWVGYPTFESGNFELGAGTPVPFIENDQLLSDLDAHEGGNYLGGQTLLDLLAEHGYNTATVGEVGPTAIHTPHVIAATSGGFPAPYSTIVIDDSTGTPGGLPLAPRLLSALASAHLLPEAPNRSNGYGLTSPYNNANSGTNTRPATLAANVVQQQWFSDVTTEALLLMFADDTRPFAVAL
jgi:hypothetical protein